MAGSSCGVASTPYDTKEEMLEGYRAEVARIVEGKAKWNWS